MKGFIVVLTAAAVLAGTARADDMPATCRVAEAQIENSFALPAVLKAVQQKRLSVLVVGAGSSALPGPSGAKTAYPARLEAALGAKFPGVTVSVTTDVKPARTAAEMAKLMTPAVGAAKPGLVVWQTGTVDAVRSVDLDEFSAALTTGVSAIHAAGADAVLMNMQYSPRTESMIALGNYAESLRWVALQQEIPLFDRFHVMKLWSELGTFDLYSDTKKLDTAERVHDCIGRLLADLIAEAARPGGKAPPDIR